VLIGAGHFPVESALQAFCEFDVAGKTSLRSVKLPVLRVLRMREQNGPVPD
jgi:hypothetical protein